MAIAPMPARKMSLNPSLRVAIRASYACDSPSATRTASASMMHQIDEKGNARNASMSEAVKGRLPLVRLATAPPRSTGRQASTGVSRSSAPRHIIVLASDVGAIQLAQQLRNARLARRAPAFRDAIFVASGRLGHAELLHQILRFVIGQGFRCHQTCTLLPYDDKLSRQLLLP